MLCFSLTPDPDRAVVADNPAWTAVCVRRTSEDAPPGTSSANAARARAPPAGLTIVLSKNGVRQTRSRPGPMETSGFEPLTPCLQGRCSPS